MKSAGILMPISSLPSDYGIGTLGKTSYEFVDFLKASNLKIWQILPLLPTGYGNSPYQSCYAKALNYYFIDFDILKKDGLLKKKDYQNIKWYDNAREVNYGILFENKLKVLKIAFKRFDKTDKDWLEFLQKGEYKDFAVFMSLKEDYNYQSFRFWGRYSKYNQNLIDKYIVKNIKKIEFWQFTQFIFLKQWLSLKQYANENGIEIMGDMPIYVSEDSVEMWKYGKDLFMLDTKGYPTVVAGVPPDGFSKDGQLWGNPVYDWAKMRENGYKWWNDRIAHAFTVYDIIRIDHFRGFDRFFAIPKGCTSAKSGYWLDGPKFDLFKDKTHLKIVAEDLGVIDDGVNKLIDQTGYPGMRVISFALNKDKVNPHKPSNFNENKVVYTGTHDNQTMIGYLESAEKAEKDIFIKQLKKQCKLLKVRCFTKTNEDILKTAIRLAFASKGDRVILPYQDVVQFGDFARINAPSSLSDNNWSFRFIKSDFTKKTSNYLKKLVKEYNR